MLTSGSAASRPPSDTAWHPTGPRTKSIQRRCRVLARLDVHVSPGGHALSADLNVMTRGLTNDYIGGLEVAKSPIGAPSSGSMWWSGRGGRLRVAHRLLAERTVR